MKTAYSFVTLRYIHDVVTGEFANVGVVLFAPETRYLEARFTISYERLNGLFQKIDHAHYRNLIRYLSNRFAELAVEVRDGLNLTPATTVEELVRRVLPPDDSSLQWSPIGGGISDDPAAALVGLFDRMVVRYMHSADATSRSDDDVIKPFRARLQTSADRLREKRIVARDYQYDFHYGWKNSIWHLYEPVSFDLVDPGSIVEKANRWLGRGVALHDSDERFKIHFLLGAPSRQSNARAFDNARHLLDKIPGEKELVLETELNSFADRVAAELASHPEEVA